MFALTWNDIDFGNKTIPVNKNILKKNQNGGTKKRHINWYKNNYSKEGEIMQKFSLGMQAQINGIYLNSETIELLSVIQCNNIA